jgi:SAM-dependent methyltransferase
MKTVSNVVTKHYTRHSDLVERIRSVLPEVGGDSARPTYEAVSQFDQFHLGAGEATRDMAALADLPPGPLLDLGCGIGGPARMLAHDYGFDITGVDLTESYCRAAITLSAWTGLDSRTRFICGSALDLPFEDASWPVVWSQHTSMNIPDKVRFYQEIARVLQPGGRFVMHDIVAGTTREPYFPVPWSATPAGSFLLPARQVHERIAESGLIEVLWRDKTPDALARMQQAKAEREAGTPEPPGPHRVLGEEFKEMRRNLGRNMAEGRVSVVQAIWRKPG